MGRAFVGVLILGALILSSPAESAQPCCPWPHEGSLVFGQAELGSEISTFDFLEYHEARRIGSWLLYEVPVFTLIPIVEPPGVPEGQHEHNYFYNYRGLGSGILYLANHLMAVSDSTEAYFRLSPLTPLLLAPNCTLKACLTPHLRLRLGTRTDLVASRREFGERGLLFTPHLGLELSGRSESDDQHPMMDGVFVDVGYGSWWNFEGPNRSVGWRLALGLAFYADR